MSKDQPTDAEILEVARELFIKPVPMGVYELSILAFARRMIDLGAEQENEECAKVCIKYSWSKGPTFADFIRTRRKS